MSDSECVSIPIQAQERIFDKHSLTDSDEEVMADLVKDHEELYNKTHKKFNARKKPRGRGLQAAATSQWMCTRHGSNLKGLAMENSTSPRLTRLPRN